MISLGFNVWVCELNFWNYYLEKSIYKCKDGHNSGCEYKWSCHYKRSTKHVCLYMCIKLKHLVIKLQENTNKNEVDY